MLESYCNIAKKKEMQSMNHDLISNIDLELATTKFSSDELLLQTSELTIVNIQKGHLPSITHSKKLVSNLLLNPLTGSYELRDLKRIKTKIKELEDNNIESMIEKYNLSFIKIYNFWTAKLTLNKSTQKYYINNYNNSELSDIIIFAHDAKYLKGQFNLLNDYKRIIKILNNISSNKLNCDYIAA